MLLTINISDIKSSIDNAKEYSDLIQIVMKHSFGNDNQKMVILNQLKDLIMNMINK